MRDTNRIWPFCNELATLWSKHPDLRFGQIVVNLIRQAQAEGIRDIFFLEDDEMLDLIRRHL